MLKSSLINSNKFLFAAKSGFGVDMVYKLTAKAAVSSYFIKSWFFFSEKYITELFLKELLSSVHTAAPAQGSGIKTAAASLIGLLLLNSALIFWVFF